MRITSKGQVTIPIDIRIALGLLPDTEVEFEVVGDVVQVPRVGTDRGRRTVEHLRGRARGGMTTDQIMALTRGEP